MDVPVPDQLLFDEALETLPRAQLAELQLERLYETMAYAYDRSALVREAWDAERLRPSDVRTLDDFREKVPFISKDAIRRFRDDRGDPFGGQLCLDPAELTAIMSTSGTTGDPTLVAERWGGAPDWPALMFRDFWGMGVRPGDFVSLFLFTFRGPTYGFVQGLGAVPLLFDYDRSELERLLRLSQRYRPTALYNFGGTMIHATAEVAAACGIDPRDAFSSYRAVVWAGEPLSGRARELAAGWGLELYEHASVGDVTACFECPAHDGMHVWEDTALVEGVDPQGRDHRDSLAVEGDGERCELVATSLVNRVAPLVRFRSDDIVRIDRRPCRCRRTHARVWVIGRKGEEVWVDGRSILPIDVWGAVESVAACRMGLFQIVRGADRETDVLRLRVGYDAVRGGRLASVRDAVAAAVLAAVGVEPQVELVPDEALLRLGPPHKIPRVTRR